MKPLTISVFVGVCLCASVFVTDGLPRQRRFKRQTTSEAPSSSSSSEPTEGTTSSTTQSQSTPNNEFGIGAAAGIGGLTRSVGLGNFQAPANSDALAPWGAFAGLNLGNGGRIGAGCSGLSCGIQLGQLVLATPQLLGIGRDFLNTQQNRPLSPLQDPTLSGDNNPSNIFNNIQSFTQRQVSNFQNQQTRLQEKANDNISNLARFGGQFFNGTGVNFGGGSTSSVSVSSENGGIPMFSSISSHLTPDGTLTTVERGSGMQNKITVQSLNPEEANGIFTGTGVQTDLKGNSGFKTSGTH